MATENNTWDTNDLGTRMDSYHTSGIKKDATQNWEEDSNRNENILGPKPLEKWVAGIVRALYQTGQLAQVVRKMDNYNSILSARSQWNKMDGLGNKEINNWPLHRLLGENG